MTQPARPHGGIVQSYRGYDPVRFPMPGHGGDAVAGHAFDHLMTYGTLDGLTPEQLADAVEIDPTQIRGLGPSVESLLAMLMARRRRILETYETAAARRAADAEVRECAASMAPPDAMRQAFDAAVQSAHIAGLERLWYRVDQRGRFGRDVVRLMGHLGDQYDVEQLAARYPFTGRQPLTIQEALAVKEELETIDRLIEQLREAARNARVFLVDMDALARFASQDQLDELDALRRQVAALLDHLAEQQGLRRGPEGYRLTPQAQRLLQGRILNEIFSDLQAARTGRHEVPVSGDGAVEQARTKPYAFGDAIGHMDVSGSLINAMIRCGADTPLTLTPADIDIHLTRNTPKCATVVCMDMSGSMRWGRAYVHVKRMALALNGLIRREYPGDSLEFVEVCTMPRRRVVAEIPELLPRPVTLHDPVVRLRADLRDGRLTEFDVPPHFTNIQQAMVLARRLLEPQDTPNRQIILITDGLPTAHVDGGWLYMLYPPDPRTERHTLREGARCQAAGIVINIFLLSSWNQSEEDIQFAHRLAERTRGRVFFVGGRDLERCVVWDYLRRRRRVL